MNQLNQIAKDFKLSCSVAIELMDSDKYDNKKRSAIISAIQILLTSEDYINMVKTEVNSIMKDKKIDLNDYPQLLVVIAESNLYLDKLQQYAVTVKSDFDIDAMKYIIYAVIYFGLLSGNVDDTSIANFKLFYPTLWKLLKIDPNKIANTSKSFFTKLCKSMSCKK